MAELLLDPNIRGWVFLPIVVITFLVGIIRHYVSILLASQKKVELHQVQDSQVMIRSRLLRENGQYIPKMAFISRRHFFNNEETGYFKTQKRAPVSQNPITDPNVMIDMLKGNVTNVLPTVLIGGWINWMLSGFVTREGSKPIFERKEINGVLTNVEEVEEHRTVFTVKNDTLEGKFKKRWTSLSPIRNSSRCILSRHSRDERYNREYRERSRERSQDRGKDRSREQRVTLPHYCGHIPVPMYYSHFLPRLIMMTPLMSIRGQIPRGTNRFSPIRRSVQRLLPRIVPPCMHRLPFNPNHYRSKNF